MRINMQREGKDRNVDKNKKYTKHKNGLQVSIPLKTIYEKIFFKEMGIGYGARNKNISFLFKLDPKILN